MDRRRAPQADTVRHRVIRRAIDTQTLRKLVKSPRSVF
jgi:hypothetical protein